MNEAQARSEMCRIGASLFARGYAHGTAGNISVRLDDGLLITPTDACLGFLDPAQLARLDANGKQVDGLPASKTLALHTRIYAEAARFDPATRCIVHTHSTHCVALSLTHRGEELVPPIVPYFVMKVGHACLLPYQRPGAPDTVDELASAIRRYGERGIALRVAMLSRLGPVAWHASPGAAMALIEELEEAAKLALLVPQATPLDEARIEDLRRAFKARW